MVLFVSLMDRLSNQMSGRGVGKRISNQRKANEYKQVPQKLKHGHKSQTFVVNVKKIFEISV